MDPFTQRMLEKAEQRSRTLGISNAAVSKFPVCDKEASSNFNAISGACATTMAMASQQQKQQKPMQTIVSGDGSGANITKLHVIEKNNKEKTVVSTSHGANSPQKVLRQFSAVDKENMDLGIEINIVTDKNVEVQVEEQDFTDDEHKVEQQEASEQKFDQPTANLRDTSRNRLQRLGALYSNTDDLSSPIHRTEGKFHADGNEDTVDSQLRKPQQRLGKLAALANTINQWEDDTSHHGVTTNSSVVQPPPPKPELPSRSRSGLEGQVSAVVSKPSVQCKVEKKNTTEKDKTKQLKWDPKVINSLEAQGFQRRESSNVKVSYEFAEESKDSIRETPCTNDKPKCDVVEENRAVGKLNANKFASISTNAAADNITQTEKKIPNVKTGLVSGRAALFESQVQSHQQQQQKPQKDPTELSLKERMKLFEKNKGEALVPKAAFGMAPAISKIIQDTNHKKDEQRKAKPNVPSKSQAVYNSNATSCSATVVKPFADSKVRDKVTALVNASTGSTIKDDIRKQREEDLQLLANRFNRQKDLINQQQKQLPTISSKNMPTPPPPPPPMSVNTSKRRSPGDVIDEDNKRPRKSHQGTQQRLYPVLPSFESNESSESDNENNCCTTASVSALSTSDEMKSAAQPLRDHNQHDQGSDDENEDSYMESEAEDSSVGLCNGSLGREIMQVVEKNDQQVTNNVKEVRYAEKDHYFGDNTQDTSINSSDASMGVDDYLDEALDDNVEEGDEEDSSHLSRDSKGTTASNSFSFRKVSTETDYNKIQDTAATSTTNNAIYMQPVKSELSVNKENDNVVTLVHTVSFYRRQQSANSANSTPVRKICREQQVLRSAMEKLDAKAAAGTSLHFEPDVEETDEDTQSDSELDDANLVQDKIKKLLEEVCKQQQVIAQTSQALNLCAATIEFSGSTESVEGERHLLVATHRRQACLDEVQRLRVEKTLRPVGAPREKGRLTIKEITIPLRQDYIRKLSLDTISGHHLVCLIKYNEHVLATKTVPTLPGLLAVKFPDVLQLNNVYADFKVTLEIYGMTAQREVLPHEVKYHINFNKKSGIKTPKKKASDNRLVMPPVQSPAGPHAVRTPALVQYGFAIFSLREIQRTSWTLTQVLGVSPLEGVVHMKVNCELSVSVEYKGFLTMFEDISGFGAWHRRWCHLNGTMLNYWKYPDDEKKKAPMGSIDLYTCTSQKVTIAPRDICARLNTMLLECQRPAKDTDQESLIIVPNGRTTTVRYLLSADTKEEREEWCAYFNKTLTLLRAWGPPQ
ncbi:anillin isoform X2 [Calliphora vicina]|uniref:anillin isoform X2 n=1 Tax=Calliphora vicina TaxID=7373 RepID=UPI00325B192F